MLVHTCISACVYMCVGSMYHARNQCFITVCASGKHVCVQLRRTGTVPVSVCVHLNFVVTTQLCSATLLTSAHQLHKKYDVVCIISSHSLTWQSWKWAHRNNFTSRQSYFFSFFPLYLSLWQSPSYTPLITFHEKRIWIIVLRESLALSFSLMVGLCWICCPCPSPFQILCTVTSA